jgi:hypothetical protein
MGAVDENSNANGGLFRIGAVRIMVLYNAGCENERFEKRVKTNRNERF